ncbi:MAG: hypothetical protein ACRDUT_12855 [Mycobacterium sp.]
MTDPHTRPLPGSAALVVIDVQRDCYADDAPLHIEECRRIGADVRDLSATPAWLSCGENLT